MEQELESVTNEPKFIDPRQRGYASYFDQLRQYNLGLQGRLVRTLPDNHPSEYADKFFIATTGSDGRLEKGPQSKVELIVYSPLEIRDEIKGVVDEIIGDDSLRVFDPAVEYKKLCTGKLSLYHEDPTKVFPNRVLDSRFLYGNELLLPLALRGVSDEFTAEHMNRILKSAKEQERYARKITREGKAKFQGDDLVHVDLDNGIAHYDDENYLGSKRGSFKYGPIRLLQTALTRGIARRISNREFDLDHLDVYPTNTVDRLHFLETEDLTGLSSSEIADLADNYKWFLWIYHQGQENWRLDGETQTRFDKEDGKNRLEDTLKILEGGRILK